MAKLADLCMHNEYRCNALLEGYQMVPYKENLLFFGGEYKYGTADWNMSVWMYNTFREDWRLLTKLPKERRHFKSIVIKDKLYVIGGTGKYRIIQDDMMVYDLIVGRLCQVRPVVEPHSLPRACFRLLGAPDRSAALLVQHQVLQLQGQPVCHLWQPC